MELRDTLRAMGAYSRTLSTATNIGVAVFLIVVVLLHLVQGGYDPFNQFMSELAMGRFGAFLLLAFLGLSVAAAAAAANLRAHGAPRVLAMLLGAAAACFLGAGLVTLAASAALHVSLVAAAFVLCGVSMYLLPLAVAAFSAAPYRLASWVSGIVMAMATGLGGSVLPPGVAQRLSAAALLFWLAFVALRLGRCEPQPRTGYGDSAE